MSTLREAAGPAISAREAEVLDALGDRLTNAEIAGHLFISVRTVESHVSSLLRKLQVRDRRALAEVAEARREGDGTGRAGLTIPPQRGPAPASRPAPLTSFVGREEERQALAKALTEHRLVTAVGPGGVGKTRLAISVLGDVEGRYPDGAWYIDLVPVTDATMIVPAVTAALGFAERQGRSDEESLLGWLSTRETLLVLDNCEHLLDGLVELFERLLLASPGLTLLATSRARLLVPFEWAFPVPGLSLEGPDGGPGDAVKLFLERAAAGGHPVTDLDVGRVASLCRDLDGMALAIELASARLPSLGLDGLEAGLSDRLELLTGAGRPDNRHGSLRSALDWSYALLDACDQAILRRMSVFAAPFTAAAADAVLTDWPPIDRGDIPNILGSLCEQSLLVPVVDATGTRYRVAETIRQYGAERLAEAGEFVEAGWRHLEWCLDAADAVEPPHGDGTGHGVGRWRSAFDAVADDLRAGLGWALAQRGERLAAHRLAVRLAELTFARGLPGEAQRRYEQAAALAPDEAASARALQSAAGAAESRHVGNEALVLHRAAADAAVRAGHPSLAAWELARAAELIQRSPGLMATRPASGTSRQLLDDAWALAGGSPTAEARAMAAEAAHGMPYDPLTAELAERAVTLACRAGDVLAESAALDALTSVQLARGELQPAAATARRRTELLAPLQMTALAALEISDAFNMAAETALAAGDLLGARELAQRGRALPFQREEAHLANARLLVIDVMAGAFDEAVTLAEAYREGWTQAGRPQAGNLSIGAYAAATVYGLRGDDELRAEWLGVVADVMPLGGWRTDMHFDSVFNGLLLLHRGDAAEAFRTLSTPPEHLRDWQNGMWRPSYAALWLEAAVLTEQPDVEARIERAQWMTVGNPVARTIVDRAAALADGDHDGLRHAAAALDAAGSRYQWARSLVMAGGRDRDTGDRALAELGTTPTVWPPG